ncbi:hypothetical protein ACHHV8_01850 [Paenibacillus sp. TAB 01]|uniref:hypothetical protein n=1 Tax=Paenibacillus sp. TAB 01 TaxID=3368988 RepID=UPI0037500BEA
MREATENTQQPTNEPINLLTVHETSPPPASPEVKPKPNKEDNLADFGSIPSPIRYFSYFFFASSALLLVIGIVYQMFK